MTASEHDLRLQDPGPTARSFAARYFLRSDFVRSPASLHLITTFMHWRHFFLLTLVAGLFISGDAHADAPPPPNPALDAGAKWPERREQLEKEWLKILGPFPASNPPLDLQILSTEKLPASPNDDVAMAARSSMGKMRWI